MVLDQNLQVNTVCQTYCILKRLRLLNWQFNEKSNEKLAFRLEVEFDKGEK